MFKALSSHGWRHLLLLLIWTAVGTACRFTNLLVKTPWNDEFATLVFSLGNSFRSIPLDRAIALETLLQPLQPDIGVNLNAVTNHLMTESTHPPVYFVLTHLWLQLFPPVDGIASLGAARSLSAIFGIISIPAIFGLGWLAFRSRLVGQLAAAMMAVSPYGIYQAQEARHYTLAILLIIASLGCLVIATRTIQQRTPLLLWLGLLWVAINSLGIAVHYFFTLTLCTEALVLLGCWIRDWLQPKSLPSSHWWRLAAVAAGTLVGGLVWIPAWQSVPDNRVSHWIFNSDFFSNGLEPVVRIGVWLITMLSMLPIESPVLPLAIASGVVLVIFFGWALPIMIAGGRMQLERSPTRTETQVLVGYVLAAIALILIISYSLGADLTIAARYQFFYFPAAITLIGAALAVCWQAKELITQVELSWTTRQQARLQFLITKGRTAVVLIWLMGCLGGLTVITNLGYQKPDRADLLVPLIQAKSQVPVLIATAHKTHEQTGEMMALGWEFNRRDYLAKSTTTDVSISSPLFLLAEQESDSHNSAITLQATLAQLPRPLDLWLVNFPRGASTAESENCRLDAQPSSKINGYKYQLYHCQPAK